MRISDWSSDVCSSYLRPLADRDTRQHQRAAADRRHVAHRDRGRAPVARASAAPGGVGGPRPRVRHQVGLREKGRGGWRERVWKDVEILVVARYLHKTNAIK